jgi:hypothetical protein
MLYLEVGDRSAGENVASFVRHSSAAAVALCNDDETVLNARQPSEPK